MSLESNGVNRVRSLQKISTWLRGTKICTSSARFELSVVTQQTVPNAPKLYEMQRNMRSGPNGVDRVVCYEKFLHDFMAWSCAPLQPIFHRLLCGNQMVPNAPKQYGTHQNMSLGPNRDNRVCLMRKLKTRLRGTKFCTSSARFALSFVRQPNGPNASKL